MGRPLFEEYWRRRFNERGRAFDGDAGIAGWSESGLQTRLRNFVRLWPGAPADTLWLDIGCGAGSYSRVLAEGGLHVIGIDYSLPSLLKARARSASVASWLAADANQLPLRQQCTDGILCFGVLQALSGSDKALAEMSALLKPGGVLWVDALNARCLPHLLSRLLRRRTHLRYETAARLTARLEAHGMTSRVHWIPILPTRLQALQPLLETRWMRWLLHTFPAVGALLSHSVLITAEKHPTAENTNPVV